MNYTTIIGLEVHVELKTASKMFCGCPADYFAKPPNTLTCPVCLGLPGALPVPNKAAIDFTVKMGLALGCQIPLVSKFDRKNYFYPDLPKGYQISQYDQPFCQNGTLALTGLETNRVIRIRRVHLEEDTAKLMHQHLVNEDVTLINFNRSGVPLMEIVTEPDFHSTAEVKNYLKQLQQLVRYLQISDADMEKGSMRLEANISLAPTGQTTLPPYRVEVKNLNSFRFVEKAIDLEVSRQANLLNQGITPDQETRGYNETKNLTYTQRSKEEAKDYRYFPEPDIPPIRWQPAQIADLKASLPELPWQKLQRYCQDYQLSVYQATILTETPQIAGEFDQKIKEHKDYSPVDIANSIINKLPLKKITSTSQTIDLNTIIQQVLNQNPSVVQDYKAGKLTAIEFLLGQAMRLSQGQADPAQARALLQANLTT